MISSGSWNIPVIIGKASVTYTNGTITGTILTEGAFTISNGTLTGRVTCQSFSETNGKLTDGGNPAVYTGLIGTNYPPATVIGGSGGGGPTPGSMIYSGYSEVFGP